jgi:hypothetical protein
VCLYLRFSDGEMAEWLKAHAWKACVLERVPRVRIPVSPPVFNNLQTPNSHLAAIYWMTRFTTCEVNGRIASTTPAP